MVAFNAEADDVRAPERREAIAEMAKAPKRFRPTEVAVAAKAPRGLGFRFSIVVNRREGAGMEGRGIRLKVKAVPGASRDEIAGWLGDALKLRVTAPAEGGKANEAIQELLAGALGVRPRSVRIVTGQSSPRKVVEVAGISAEEAMRRLGFGAPPPEGRGADS